MVASLVAFAQKNATLSGDPVVDKPAGTILDDLLILMGWSASDAMTPPAGFNLHAASLGTKYPFAWKFAGGAEPANYTVVVAGATSNNNVILAAYRGVNKTTPFDDVKGVSGTGALIIPTLTTLGPARLLGSMAFKQVGAITWTHPVGMTERWDTASNPNAWISAGADQEIASAGPVGTRTWTPSSGAQDGVAYMYALNPATFPGVAGSIEDMEKQYYGFLGFNSEFDYWASQSGLTPASQYSMNDHIRQALAGYPGTINDKLHAFYSATSGLTPAAQYGIAAHKTRFLRNWLTLP